ncbi:hypothetical protein CsSME_00015435 [Camellia sinensis var. sinensis]
MARPRGTSATWRDPKNTFYSNEKEQKNLLWRRSDPHQLEKSSSGYNVSSSWLKTDGGFVGGSGISVPRGG